MKLSITLSGYLLISCISTSLAQPKPSIPDPKHSKPCTRAEEALALGDYDKLHKWNDVYWSFKRFAQCDDGAISEGFSERIGWLLVHDWKHFSDLNRLVRLNPNFKAFVVSHIDDMTAFDDWQLVRRSARHHCPTGARKLCTTIDNAAAKIKKEQHP